MIPIQVQNKTSVHHLLPRCLLACAKVTVIKSEVACAKASMEVVREMVAKKDGIEAQIKELTGVLETVCS